MLIKGKAISHESFDIRVGHQIIYNLPKWLRKYKKKHAIIIFDKKVKTTAYNIKHCFTQAGWKVNDIPLSANESPKKLDSLKRIYEKFYACGADRQTIVVSIGGGSISDVAGFAAATYLRGLTWVVIPTTLLAQVDSAIGGKTGVNFKKGKNFIGAFHQPSLIVCDAYLLKSLPKKEMRSGLGEIIKYAIIFDPAFFKYLKKNWRRVLEKKEPYLSSAIRTSVKWKVKTIHKDPKDQHGIRKRLNFGHTIGHAIESTLGFGKISHGEAVICGMRVANALSMITKRVLGAEYNKIENLLSTVSDSKPSIHIDEKKICQHLKYDKKKSKGKNEFILLKGVGNTFVSTSIKNHHIREAIRSSLF